MDRKYPHLEYSDIDKSIEELLRTILEELRELREKIEKAESRISNSAV